MTRRVIVVGSVNVDLVVRADRLPRPGETVIGGTFGRHHGGKGGNQAVAAARLGARTFFVGAVGDDAYGAEATGALAAEGVDVSKLTKVVGGATGVALIVVDSQGENLIVVAGGANLQVTADTVRASLAAIDLGEGDALLVSHEIPTESVHAALAFAREAGAVSILNPAPSSGLTRSTFGLADIITPNRGELASLVAAQMDPDGGREPDLQDLESQARALLAPTPEGSGVRGAVVVTLGPNGALLVSAGAGQPAVTNPAPQVESVDSTGAGDAFNGALAVALVERLKIEEAVERAVVAGALATTRVGARDALPTAAELDALMATAPD